MLVMSLAQVATATQGTRVASGVDVAIKAVETDTRKPLAGRLFVALKGDHFDGHAFCEKAVDAGACALLVERRLPIECAQIVVKDTRLALGDLARWQRLQFRGPVAAITGSNGKTTVKEMVSAIIRVNMRTLATGGNFNNDIGLPLTLLRLSETDQALVLELGANHIGEIAYTADIARPNVAVVTNVSQAHIEGFGSRDGVAKAKSEIFGPLNAHGVAVFAIDSPDTERFIASAAPATCWRFGVDAPMAEFNAAQVELLGLDGARFELVTPQGMDLISLAVPGIHNVRNAVAASAVAMAMGASLAQIKEGLEGFTGVGGRLNRSTPTAGLELIDDTYNANPASFEAAVRLLAGQRGACLLAAGDMGEMGSLALESHRELGHLVRELNIELFATGSMMRHCVENAGKRARYFDSQDALMDALDERLGQLLPETQVTLLVKGSRFTRMERVVARVQNQLGKDIQC
jgi:UDP-N-acetylmuramoyl-tripeptide--D-alanyl-D-alanine ligase